MGLFSGSAERKEKELQESYKFLERKLFDFPAEIPAIGQVVKIAHYVDGNLSMFESTVISRSHREDSVGIRVQNFAHGDRIGTQEFRLFEWNRSSKKWTFSDPYTVKNTPAVVRF